MGALSGDGCLEALGRVPGRLVNPGVQLEGALWPMFPLILVLLLSSFLPRLLLLLPILITWDLPPSPEGMFLSSHFPTLVWSPDSRPVEVRKCKGHLA